MPRLHRPSSSTTTDAASSIVIRDRRTFLRRRQQHHRASTVSPNLTVLRRLSRSSTSRAPRSHRRPSSSTPPTQFEAAIIKAAAAVENHRHLPRTSPPLLPLSLSADQNPIHRPHPPSHLPFGAASAPSEPSGGFAEHSSTSHHRRAPSGHSPSSSDPRRRLRSLPRVLAD